MRRLFFSVAVLCYHSDTTLHPVNGRVLTLHGYPHHADKVVRETNRGKNTPTFERDVEWAFVGMITLQLRRLHRHEPHNWNRTEEDLRITFFEYFFVRVPSTAFNLQAVNEGTIFWLLRSVDTLWVANNFEVELDVINRDLVFTGVILLDSR